MTQLDLALDSAHALGEVTYNGFVFPPAIKATVSFSPEISDDGRTTKYVRADLSYEFVFTDGMGSSGTIPYVKGNSVDAEMDNLRQRLSRPGQRLQFTSRGAGTFDIQNGIKYDVNNGPKPKIIDWTPLGYNRSCRITWACSTWFAECLSTSGLTGIAQFGYSVSWGINQSGYLSRTISGKVEVPLSRDPRSGNTNASTQQRASADEVWEQILARFPRIERFQRESNHTLSNDRKMIDFSISDTEIASPNPYFEGIVEVSANRRIGGQLMDGGFTKWVVGLRGKVEVAPGYSLTRGWVVFASIFSDLFLRSFKERQRTSRTDSPTEPATVDSTMETYGILTSLEFDEELYGRSFSFSATWMLFCSLAGLFKATGLFQPLDSISDRDASWNKWKTSTDKIQSARGWNNYHAAFHELEGDVIVDLCEPTGNLALREPPTRDSIERYNIAERDRTAPGIDPDKSWVHYEADFTIVADESTIVSIPLQKSNPLQEFTNTMLPVDGGTNPRVIPLGSDSAGVANLARPIIHRVRPTIYKLIFTGSAIRVGYQISTPNVVSVGGVIARKVGMDVSTPNKVVAKGMDVKTGKPYTVYGTSWRKEYVLESLPPNGKIVTDGNVAMYP